MANEIERAVAVVSRKRSLRQELGMNKFKTMVG